jgi:hypothetical protein
LVAGELPVFRRNKIPTKSAHAPSLRLKMFDEFTAVFFDEFLEPKASKCRRKIGSSPGLSVESATLLVSFFGASCLLWALLGAALGQRIYHRAMVGAKCGGCMAH